MVLKRAINLTCLSVSYAVRDLQTDKKFQFVAGRWLAVEKDDGQVKILICRLVQFVAGRWQWRRMTDR